MREKIGWEGGSNKRAPKQNGCQFVRIKASVTRASTGNSNLFPVDAYITKAWDSRDELRDVRVLGSQAKDSLDERKVSTGLPNPITRN